ncbi:uncharacterized protein EURHEDRAFT_63627 [Aspergillus ruber CBS 135680]|uniref:Uncharacterized protein n=1 Tax=Aspergillus ruber (strain CBS 135680) TaxID=1388766 RepID=A0A017SDU9_ASPRC|nr:uncharacterized protein EURHEDRAFT_63627 [Aspergillus ruber CBS 135680]EYE95107.1 hypothetical protein EURHEDRAFT_63627 [Aspergillus ruber CBS 135680]
MNWTVPKRIEPKTSTALDDDWMIQMLLYPLITSSSLFFSFLFFYVRYTMRYIYDRLYYYCLSTIDDDIIFLSQAIFHDYVPMMCRVCHLGSYDGR